MSTCELCGLPVRGFDLYHFPCVLRADDSSQRGEEFHRGAQERMVDSLFSLAHEESNVMRLSPPSDTSLSSEALTPIALSEAILDYAIIDSWRHSDSFAAGLVQCVAKTPWSVESSVREAVRSVSHGDGDSRGQTDVLAKLTVKSGESLVLLCESKVDASFMPRQGERYQARARSLSLESGNRPVHSVLLAPQRYLAAANPQALYFDARVALEDALKGFTNSEREQLHGAAMLKAIVERAADGRPLGTKGLFPEVHYPLAAELRRRGSALEITNNPTDWIFLSDRDRLGKGAKLRYRIREARAEVRLRDVVSVNPRHVAAIESGMSFERNNTEVCFFRHIDVTGNARFGAPSPEDIVKVADVLESFARWWRQAPKD